MFDSKSRGEWGLGNREWWWSGSESWKFSVGRAQSYHLWIKGWSNALALWFGFPVFRHTRTMTHPSFHKLLLPSTLQPKQLVPIFSLILPTYSVDFFFFFMSFATTPISQTLSARYSSLDFFLIPSGVWVPITICIFLFW